MNCLRRAHRPVVLPTVRIVPLLGLGTVVVGDFVVRADRAVVGFFLGFFLRTAFRIPEKSALFELREEGFAYLCSL